MQLFTLDPLSDNRWSDLVASHPHASIFHTPGWLRALSKTYSYRPLVLTSSPPQKPLSDGIPFCEIQSWVTGSRLVSLPFADHAEPLLSESGAALEPQEWVRTACGQNGWRYVEIRPISNRSDWSDALESSQTFWLHTLSLAPAIEQLYGNLHRDCIRRRIQHAKREHLEYERGASSRLLQEFYDLLIITRKRHKLFPQPQSWFRNLISALSPNAEIRVARKAGIPVAAILTLRFRDTVVYKYGCSNHRFHHLAGMPFLFWQLIEESKSEGATQIDFGRTEPDNEGLLEFKDRLGTARTKISYLRHYQCVKARTVQLSPPTAVGKLFAILPGALSSAMGRLVYRHLG
jgi:CelD/BcsL family acetyltransferase involved in cellulose biosynthesis